MESGPKQRRARWWPALLIVIGVVGALTWVWAIQDSEHRQGQVMASESILLGGGILFVVWLLLLSRLSWGVRLKSFAALVVLVGGFFVSFRYVGVNGDLVPVFEFRWRGVEAIRTGRALTGPAADWPGFLGGARDGVADGFVLDTDWEAHPPQLVWRRPVGFGWSGFAVVGNRAVTQEQHDEEERVVCYDLATGEVMWAVGDEVAYRSELAGAGPRATPTIVGDRVYTFGATGILNALELETGRRIWRRDVVKEADGEVLPWGMSGSPLVHQGLVIVPTGGPAGAGHAAYAAETGERVWISGDGPPGYGSPFVATLAGSLQVVVFNGKSVSGLVPGDGRVLWSSPWSGKQPNVAQPVPVGSDRLLVSSGYGIGSQLLEIAPSDAGEMKVKTIWRSRRMKSKFANMVLHRGAVYGLDDGILACMDVATGDRKWKGGRYGHGQMIRVGEVLLISAEMGDMVLVALDPEEHRELARFSVIDGKMWNPPALAGSRLLVRNDREAALFLLPTGR